MSAFPAAIACVADEDTVLGLKLAGIQKAAIVNDASNARQMIIEFADDQEIAVLIISEEIAAKNEELINSLLERPFPIIIEIPSSKGRVEKEHDTLKELVKRAVGIELNI